MSWLDSLLLGVGAAIGWSAMQAILVILIFVVVYFLAKRLEDKDDE